MKITYEFDTASENYNPLELSLIQNASSMYDALFNIEEIITEYRKKDEVNFEEFTKRIIDEVIESKYNEIS